MFVINFLRSIPMFIVKTIYVKPAGASWFQAPVQLDLSPFKLFMSTHPTLVKNKTRKVGKNKRVNIRVFADQAAYDAFVQELASQPVYQAQLAHQESNNIKVTTKKFLVVE